MSEGSKTKRKVTELHVTWNGEAMEGKPTVVMGNMLALFADTCGVDRVARTCIDSYKKNPTVVTDEKAHEITKNKTWPIYEPLPQYRGYSYIVRLKNDDKRDRLNELAEQLGISDQFKAKLLY